MIENTIWVFQDADTGIERTENPAPGQATVGLRHTASIQKTDAVYVSDTVWGRGGGSCSTHSGQCASVCVCVCAGAVVGPAACTQR